MQMTELIPKLGRSDAKVIGRDRFPLFMLLFAVYLAVVLRYALPWVNNYLAENGVLPNETISQSLSDYYPMIIAFLVFFTGALIVGSVFGFVLLDEKDDNTIKAMLVTPIPLNQYVLYRVGLPSIFGLLIIVGMGLFIGQALVPLWQLILLSTGAALTAPIASLFLGVFAENKLQGFAYSKFTGIGGWFILLGWFFAEPWQWLFGVFPPFWIAKAYWLALEGDGLWWVALIVGGVLQVGMISWLMKRFNVVAYR